MSIESNAERPRYFNDIALKKAKEIASTLSNEDELESIHVSFNGDRAPITSKTLANIDSLFKTAYEDWGSVEGTVQVVSKKRGKPRIQIYDDVADKYIKCLVWMRCCATCWKPLKNT